MRRPARPPVNSACRPAMSNRVRSNSQEYQLWRHPFRHRVGEICAHRVAHINLQQSRTRTVKKDQQTRSQAHINVDNQKCGMLVIASRLAHMSLNSNNTASALPHALHSQQHQSALPVLSAPPCRTNSPVRSATSQRLHRHYWRWQTRRPRGVLTADVLSSFAQRLRRNLRAKDE
jgi:hypothetical protein